MSTRQVLGAVGAVVGFYVSGGSLQGAQYGWALDSKITDARDATRIVTADSPSADAESTS